MAEFPFTTEQFFNVFENYNSSIWPIQIFAYLVATLALILTFFKKPVSGKLNYSILGIFWLWIGVVYHWLFFSKINKAAFIFGALFIIQGVLLLFMGFNKSKLQFLFRNDTYGLIGLILVIYAMIIYPIIGFFSGHAYPHAPMFGVAPCPTTIFTFGILLWTTHRIPPWLLVVPILWSVIGLAAAIKFGVYEDAGLIIAGITSVALLVYRNRRKQYGELAKRV